MSLSSLRAHQIYPLFFNLGGRLYPISIRDQMVRAQMVIDGAIEQGLIGFDPWRPLLVVGAGAAGATAGMWAARAGIPTLLIERDSSAFNRQGGCRSRWLDPSQYDWPVAHWGQPHCPVVPIPTPLPWTANWSQLLAALWQIRLHSTPFPFFSIAYSTTVTAVHPLFTGLPPRPMGWEVNLSGSPQPLQFGMILWTVGFGAERCDVGNYVGFPFWSSDPFELPQCGVPPPGPEIVISGSGDGALQDFLRVTTNRSSAKEIYQNCGLSAVQRENVERVLQSAEDLAQRAIHWGPHRRGGVARNNDHLTLRTLHEAHRALVWGILGPPGITPPNKDVKAALDTMIRTPLPQIHLVHSCDHFSNSYGLNHFLVLLIAHFLSTERGQKDIFIPGRNVASVTGVGGHVCTGNWLTCHGQQHEIQLVEATDCRADPNPPKQAEKLTANVLIIRHGLDSSVSSPLPDVALPRQTIPYHPLA